MLDVDGGINKMGQVQKWYNAHTFHKGFFFWMHYFDSSIPLYDVVSSPGASKALPFLTSSGWATRYLILFHIRLTHNVPQLASSKSMATNITREARVAQPKLTGKGRGPDNLLLAALELVDVPGGENNLAV
jgi:hypothetical protein